MLCMERLKVFDFLILEQVKQSSNLFESKIH